MVEERVREHLLAHASVLSVSEHENVKFHVEVWTPVSALVVIIWFPLTSALVAT
jgi:hypothetical protein